MTGGKMVPEPVLELVSQGLPEDTNKWLAACKNKRYRLEFGWKPVGGVMPMINTCFQEVEEVPMHMMKLVNARGRILSYVGYNVFPVRGKLLLMIEYTCTEEDKHGQGHARHLTTILVASVLANEKFTGIISNSINDQSARMYSRYFGLAKVFPEEFLDATTGGPKLSIANQNILEWAYCCRDMGTSMYIHAWERVWRSHRRVQVAWHDSKQRLPAFNAHLDLAAPGVRTWLKSFLGKPQTD